MINTTDTYESSDCDASCYDIENMTNLIIQEMSTYNEGNISEPNEYENESGIINPELWVNREQVAFN